VFDGDPATPKNGTAPPNFWPMSVVAGWIKMPLGAEVNLGQGDIVLGWVAVPPPKKGTAPSFPFMSVVAKRLDG